MRGERVDPVGEHKVTNVVDQDVVGLEAENTNELTCVRAGRLIPHATLAGVVGAGDDATDIPRWWNSDCGRRSVHRGVRIRDDNPWPVDGAELGEVLDGRHGINIVDDLASIIVGRRIQNREDLTAPLRLAVIQHGLVNGRGGTSRNSKNRDVGNLIESVQTRAGCCVSDVVRIHQVRKTVVPTQHEEGSGGRNSQDSASSGIEIRQGD